MNEELTEEGKLAIWKQVLDDDYGINTDNFSNKEIEEIISFLKAVLDGRKKDKVRQ